MRPPVNPYPLPSARATARKEAHDKAIQPPAAAEEANPYMNNPALLEDARNALGPE